MHRRQGRSQGVHRGIERRSIRIERSIAGSKLAHGALFRQLTKRGLNVTSSNIQRRGNNVSCHRKRLQRQPSTNAAHDIGGLKRRIQRALPTRKLARTATAGQQHAPAANKHHRRIRQHHDMVAGT